MNYAAGQREVTIDRGAMGFGFTLRHPAPTGGGANGEPTYHCGAQVRSVEEKGPASKGGLDKEEVVAAVNNVGVHGKSYLQVIRMIQATSRRLVLKVLPASALDDLAANCSESIPDDDAMDDTSAEKENQLVVPRAADRRSCMSEPSSSSSWPHSPPSGSSGDLPAVVIAAEQSSASPVPPLDLGADVTTTPTGDDALRDFELTRDSSSSADNYGAVRTHRASTALVVTPSSTVASTGGGTTSFTAKAAGLTRSTGNLFPVSSMESSAVEPRGPIVTLKKAYQSSLTPREIPLATAEPRQSLLSSSSTGSGTAGVIGRPHFSAGSDNSDTREHTGYGGGSGFGYPSVLDRGLRSTHSAQTVEPRINFKKRKQNASAASPSSSSPGLTSSRAQSVGHLPGSQDAAHHASSRITGLTSLTHYPTGAGGSSPLSAKQRLGASSTHNILTSMPSAARHRVASPPSERDSPAGGGGSVGITLMHSPLRRGSSPARSVAAAVAPLSGGEEADAGAGPSYHETRFSVVQDRIVSSVHKQPSVLSRVAWQQPSPPGAPQSRNPPPRSVTEGGTVSALLSGSAAATAAVSSSTSSVASYTASGNYMVQQETSNSNNLSSGASSVTYTTTISSICRTRNQRARAEFMEAKPTVPPALPLPKVTASSPNEAGTSAAAPAGSESGSCVTRRDSYINAVKTNRSTMLSPDAIEEGEEQDDGADSSVEDAIGGDQHDSQAHSLAKAKRFFGESWARRSGKNKTPKLKEALATSGKESLGVGGSGSEKKFYLSVKVVRDDGKEPKSRSWKSFSLTIENDVMYLMRERKESSASSSSSVEDVPSPIPLRQCHFEWTAPDAQSRKKYLVCRMIVSPPSPPDSTSSLAANVLPTAHSTPEPSTASAALHGTSPPTSEPCPSAGGVSEYKLQFLDSEQMQSFYNCLPNSAASVSVLSDFAATYPPGPKAAKKGVVASKPPKKSPAELELAALAAGDVELAGALGSFSTHSSKTKLKALVKNIRGWKSSSTESTSTTSSGAVVSRTVRYEECTLRQRSVSPDELGRSLPGFTFGVPLTQVPRSSASPYVPFVVELCTKIVEACGLHCVGVYRVSPKKAVIDALESELNECGSRLEMIDRTNERWNDVHAVSGLLKCFLRKMPDPLFPHSLYREFVNASNRNHPHERKMLHLQRLLTLMESDEAYSPEYKHHRETLLYLVQHLRRVAAHSHVNKMNTKNLASMIAPNVFRAPDVSNPVMIMESTTHGATILELVLNHHEWIFSTDIDAGRSVPPPVTQEFGHNIAAGEACGGEHETEGGGSHNNDDALGGAEDTGATNRSGENGRDILAQLLDAAIKCQGEVSPEAAATSVSDEGGFDEVDIDAAVRRRQQMDAAAAAAVAAAGSASGDTTPAASASTNGSGSKPSEELASASRLGDYPRNRRGSACLQDVDDGAVEWRQVSQRAEMALAASATDLRAGPGRRDAGGRWFGATVQPLALEAPLGLAEAPSPPPPLPPRLYDAAVERRRLGSPCEAAGLDSDADAVAMRHQRQLSKSLDSLTAASGDAAEAVEVAAKAPALVERQASSPAPQVPPRSAAAAALRRQRAKAADGLHSSHLT